MFPLYRSLEFFLTLGFIMLLLEMALSSRRDLMSSSHRFSALFLLWTLVNIFLGGPAVAQTQPSAAQLYNEACRLSLAGNADSALEAFKQAVDMGFDDFNFALEDPDLGSIQRHPEFQSLLTAHHSRLHLLSAEKTLRLGSESWTDPSYLLPADGNTSTAPAPAIRLRWQPKGLDFELILQQDYAQWQGDKIRSPWDGGPGLVLTLGVPDGASSFESPAHFVLAFGLEKSAPVGAMFTPSLGWQRVLQLDPDVKLDPQKQTLVMTGTVPWQSIQPFHPLVDSRLGFNAALRTPAEGPMLQAELLPDPAAFRPQRSIRRYVPLEFDPHSENIESLVGKVDASVNHGVPLDLDLAVVSREKGTASLTVDFTNNQGRSLLPGGAVSSSIRLNAGFNQVQQQADFSQLNPGLYVVKATVEFPSGHQATWNTRVLQLGADWEGVLAERIEALPVLERPTGKFYLNTIVQAVGSLPERFNPGPIATTLDDLNRLLTRADQSGSIMPNFGIMLLVYPGPQGEDRLCTLYLPEGYASRGPINPVLVLTQAPGLEPRMVQRVARSYEFDGHLDSENQATKHSPIYLFPHAQSLSGDVQGQALAEARAGLNWALDFFKVDQLSLCGVDFQGGPALRLLKDTPKKFLGLEIMAGKNLIPWPQASSAFLSDKLGPATKGIPVTWLDFSNESAKGSQGAQILEVLQDLGYDLVQVTEVPGGLSMTQVADRVVLWAESLP